MKMVLVAASVAALGFGAMLAPSGAHAADAANPYGNVDQSNDMGNNTGDSRVPGLNAQQLDQNYKGPYHLSAPAGPTTVVPAQPAPNMPPPPPPPGTVVR